MRYTYCVPCALSPEQVSIVFRDLCRALNYLAPTPEHKTAFVSNHGLVSSRWNELPPWVTRVEASPKNGTVEIYIDVEADITAGESDRVAEALINELSSIFAYPVRPYAQRVFCIGWQRTGTTSLTVALRMLGLFSWHFLPWVIGHTHFSCDSAAGDFDFDTISEYTAVSDMPIPSMYQALDQTFPGSLFIYTTRDQNAWESSAIDLARGLIKRDGCLHSVDRWAYGTEEADPALFRSRFVQHQAEVLDYFSGQSNFLVIDVTCGNPWNTLCSFLQLPRPNQPFPHLSRR